MTTSETAVTCYGCGGAVPADELYMSVTYHLERLGPDGVISVDLADALVVTCAECTPPRTVVEDALAAAGLPVWRAP